MSGTSNPKSQEEVAREANIEWWQEYDEGEGRGEVGTADRGDEEEGRDEEESWEAASESGDEEEGRDDAAETGEETTDRTEGDSSGTLRRPRRRGRRRGQGGIGGRKCLPASPILSRWSPKVAYPWSLLRFPKGTRCN
jgi:hypothetical protein